MCANVCWLRHFSFAQKIIFILHDERFVVSAIMMILFIINWYYFYILG